MTHQQYHPTKILFICKERNHNYGPSFGLINSCKFIVNALERYKIESKVITVIDNNDIDREVTAYKPTHVFIEALWVVPSKFPILFKLHPKVKWYIRIHSKIPFLAHEGMAIGWIKEYADLADLNPNFHITANNLDIGESMNYAYGINVDYFPNIYDPGYSSVEPPRCGKIKLPKKHVLDVGCFGAIRPMKNQLYQALAAITFGNELGFKIRFHINGNRVETKGDGVFHNLISAFKNSDHELVNHDWMNHEEFIQVIKQMDLGMQVSFSETFNIVAADFVWNNIPVIGSPEIEWLDPLYQANPTCLNSIIKKLYTAYEGGILSLQKINLKNLKRYNKDSVKVWLESL